MEFPGHNVTDLDALAKCPTYYVSVSFTRGQPVNVHIQYTCTCSQCSLHDERNAVHFHDKNTLSQLGPHVSGDEKPAWWAVMGALMFPVASMSIIFITGIFHKTCQHRVPVWPESDSERSGVGHFFFTSEQSERPLMWLHLPWSWISRFVIERRNTWWENAYGGAQLFYIRQYLDIEQSYNVIYWTFWTIHSQQLSWL